MQTRHMQHPAWMRYDGDSSNYLPTSWTQITASGVYTFNGPYGTNIKVSEVELDATFNVNAYNSQIQFLYDTNTTRYLEKGQWIKASTTAGNYTRLAPV